MFMFMFDNAILLRGVEISPLMKDVVVCKKGLESGVAEFSSIFRTQGLNIFVKIHCNHFDKLGKDR